MVTLAFTSGKGGTGKTTVVLNLGAVLASEGKRVVLVDGDIFSRSLTIISRPRKMEKGLAALFLEPELDVDKTLSEITTLRNLFLIPSLESFDLLAKVDHLLKSKDLVIRRMKEISTLADYVFIDTPAGISREVMFSVSLGQEYCIVSETGSMELEGALVIDVLLRNLGLKRRGLILNRIRGKLSDGYKKACTATLGPILGTIPFDIRFFSSAEGGSIFYLDYPSAPASIELEGIARRLVS
jgi:MinD-like ATPase involved in chromosome partitioning or flagellar assembly